MRDHASASSVLAVIIDVRSIARNVKSAAFASQPYGWTFLPVLSESGTVAIGAVQLPLFQGEVKLVSGVDLLSCCLEPRNRLSRALNPVLHLATVCGPQDVLHSVNSAQSLRTLVETIASGAKSTPVTFVDGASAFVRLEDPQVPSIALPTLVRVVAARVLCILTLTVANEA